MSWPCLTDNRSWGTQQPDGSSFADMHVRKGEELMLASALFAVKQGLRSQGRQGSILPHCRLMQQ